MLTPSDMIKAWKNEYRATVARLEQKETLQLPSAGESKQILDGIHREIFEEYGGWNKILGVDGLVARLNRQAETDDRFSLIKHPENLFNKVWSDEKECFIYVTYPELPNCMHKNPPSYYNWFKPKKIVCTYCLDELI